MNNTIAKFFSTGYLILILFSSVAAQTHYTYTTNTGNNMTVLIKKAIVPSINNQPIERGDEIAVFSTNGLCVGAIIWNDSNSAITVWGDNEQTQTVDGILPNDTLRFRIWDISSSNEVNCNVSFSVGGPVYAVDGLAILQTLTSADVTSSRKFSKQLQMGNKGALLTVYDLNGQVLLKTAYSESGSLQKIASTSLKMFAGKKVVYKVESDGVIKIHSSFLTCK